MHASSMQSGTTCVFELSSDLLLSYWSLTQQNIQCNKLETKYTCEFNSSYTCCLIFQLFSELELFNPLRCQDHKPLIALPEMPKELQDHALKPEPEYEEESKVTAEFLKA